MFKTLTLPTGTQYTQPLGLFINNEFVSALGGKTITSIDPSTKTPIVDVQCAGVDDVDVAVAAAKAAHHPSSEWRTMDPTERVATILRLATLVDTHAETLANIEAWDSGKPKDTNAMADIQAVANYLRYCAGWADKIHGKQIPLAGERFALTKRYPLLVGCIVPWNYPLSMASWKFCPALACGCSIVMKSSEITPLSLLYFAQLVKEAGFPPGVFNVLSGYGADVGDAIARNKDLQKVAFTGSTVTGQKVMQAASENMKSVSLECGGKSPLVVFADADLEQAAKWACFGVMYNSGQNCTANSRIIVEESVHDKFLELILAELKSEWNVGNVFDPNTKIGPLVSQQQYDKVTGYIALGQEEGATLHQVHEVPSNGFFVAPTVFTNVREDMRIVQEEIFGPVVCMSTFKTMEEAIEKANGTIYGLAAMVFSLNFNTAHTVADRLDAGSVYINSSNDEDMRVPFGGVKMSGFGRELGEEALSLYTELKSIFINYGSKF